LSFYALPMIDGFFILPRKMEVSTSYLYHAL